MLDPAGFAILNLASPKARNPTTFKCEPRGGLALGGWRAQVALEELRRLHMHGITAGELARYKAALLYDSEQLAEQAGSVPSIDNLDFLMESDMLGHTVMDQEQGHAALVAVADFVTLEDVHTMVRAPCLPPPRAGARQAPVRSSR